MRVRVAAFIRKNDSVLLVKHRKNGREYWLLPGGGVHTGEKTEDALKRELYEEIRLRAEVRDLLFVVEAFSGRNHIIQPTYIVHTDENESIGVGTDRRVVDFAYFDGEGLEKVTLYPDIKNELQKYLSEGSVSRRYICKKWID